ncbi:histone-lysine N-methyltransferase SETMAR [Trichonephila inaurata madagascariensis]|uniref:Histone-lysine N-methyltransferase SETMAR n=1 Tax=Trichonephila inaurata madagascariensis TaxID=2747483 RepID=A0A8X7CIF7_9ARAC|nr:histone-lysine N-methyltransferase SETMAR [Trichonephila inaurata madagascariensis]
MYSCKSSVKSRNISCYKHRSTAHIHQSELVQQRSEMDVSKELIRGCLLYDFKVCLSVTASSCRIRQVFGDSAVNERTARHWFQKFRLGDSSLCDKAQTGRHRPWMTKPCRQPLRRTVVKCVGNLPDNSILPVKWLDFI